MLIEKGFIKPYAKAITGQYELTFVIFFNISLWIKTFYCLMLIDECPIKSYNGSSRLSLVDMNYLK